MVDYQRNDIVRLVDTKFEELKGQLWFSDNAFVIAEACNGSSVSFKELDVPVSVSEVLPMPINKKYAGNIYYDPVIAASVVGPYDEIPVHSTDYSYFMDSFGRVVEEDGTTLRTLVDGQKFKYVHEIQHWLRERYETDDLKIHHKIIALAEVQFRKLWDLRISLLGTGVSSYHFLYEMANMLYLKWMTFFDEKEADRWKKLEQATGDALLELYHGAIFRIKQQSRIYSATVLSQAISVVSDCAKQENIAEVFDLMLRENGKTKDGGAIQNTTPQILTWLLVEVMQPQLGERWYDPAAGFSGFLVEIDKYLRKNNGNYRSLTKKEMTFQLTEALSSREIQKEIARIGFCNTRFHGLRSKVMTGNSLETKDDQQYEGVICEPPIQTFTLTGKSTTGNANRNKQTEFVETILNSLNRKKSGRAAIVLPERFLYNNSEDFRSTRKRLMEEYNTHIILRLPKGIYLNPSISMCVIFVNCAHNEDKSVMVYDMQSVKLNPGQLQSMAVFNGFIKTFRDRIPDSRSSLYSLDELRGVDYRITVGENTNSGKMQMESPSHYVKEANKTVKEIRNLLTKIEGEING